MNKQIETIFKKISNDSSLLEKLLQIDDINELADFFISLGCEVPKDELTEYLGNMCKNILSDKAMENIAGGKAITNHKLSKILSASLATISLANPIISAAPPQKTTNSKAQTQTEENTQTTESTAWDHIKKHAAEYTIGAGVTIGGLVWGAYKLFGEEPLPFDPNDPIVPIRPREVIEAVSNAPRLTCDDWFTRLCGNENLNEYPHLKESYHIDNKQRHQIKIDMARITLPGYAANSNANQPIPAQLQRILETYHSAPGHMRYAQEFQRIIAIIYGKFMIDRCGTDIINRRAAESNFENIPALDPNDEAKIYFIYSRFMDLIKPLDMLDQNHEDFGWGAFYARRFARSCVGQFKLVQAINTLSIDNLHRAFIGLFLTGEGDYWRIQCNQTLNPQNTRIWRVWDYIISNDSNLKTKSQGFKRKETLYALSNTLFSHMCVDYEADPNDDRSHLNLVRYYLGGGQ